MTAVRGLEISRLSLPLTQAGSLLISQQIGYLHLWRFTNADGSLSLDGEVSASFGGQNDEERVPLAYNASVKLVVPVDRVLLTWSAQAGRVAEFYYTRDPQGVEMNNPPSRQIVYPGQASRIVTSVFNVPSGSGGTILAADPLRQRAIIKAMLTNTSRIFLAQVGGANLGNTMPLEPGESVDLFVAGVVRGISEDGTQQVRILQEIS